MLCFKYKVLKNVINGIKYLNIFVVLFLLIMVASLASIYRILVESKAD